MNAEKKVLVLGGTEAMGVYLVPELRKMGYQVHVVSLDDRKSDDPMLVYTKGDAKDEEYLTQLLKNGYDAIVDFMIYHTEEFRQRYKLLLEKTSHYIYLSSYRIYAESEGLITESSPRLLDVSNDAEFLASEDYSLYKARGEDILARSGYGNWTIIRPAITYSKFRYQLVTLEANVVVHRMMHGKTVVLPEAAMGIQGTMSWGGDVGKMIARLVLNRNAMGERYTVATAEHHTWEEIAGYYAELQGLKYVTASVDDFISIVAGDGPDCWARWQLMYDRMFNRMVDNRKILDVTGLKQSDLMPLKEGLRRELSALPKGFEWPKTDINTRMDAYLAERK